MRWAGWKPGGLHAGGFSTILPLCRGGCLRRPLALGAVGLEASLPGGVSGGSSGCFWVLPQFGARWLSALGAAFWLRAVPRGDCSRGCPAWGSSPGGLGAMLVLPQPWDPTGLGEGGKCLKCHRSHPETALPGRDGLWGGIPAAGQEPWLDFAVLGAVGARPGSHSRPVSLTPRSRLWGLTLGVPHFLLRLNAPASDFCGLHGVGQSLFAAAPACRRS